MKEEGLERVYTCNDREETHRVCKQGLTNREAKLPPPSPSVDYEPGFLESVSVLVLGITHHL